MIFSSLYNAIIVNVRRGIGRDKLRLKLIRLSERAYQTQEQIFMKAMLLRNGRVSDAPFVLNEYTSRSSLSVERSQHSHRFANRSDEGRRRQIWTLFRNVQEVVKKTKKVRLRTRKLRLPYVMCCHETSWTITTTTRFPQI